jgi:hypothetical protein
MSERALRKIAVHGHACPTESVGRHWPDGKYVYCDCGLDKALADEPDVVKVLRWAKKAHDSYRDEYGNTKPDDVAYLNGMKSIPYFVEREFHLRLTDGGGWEYTDE